MIEQETPDWVDEGDEDVEVGDLSTVPNTDVIDTVRGVVFDIRKANLDTQEFSLEDGSKCWAKRNLALQLAVGAQGTDGEGKFAGKVFFPRLLLQVNRDDFPTAFEYDSYEAGKGKKWRPIKQFFAAMGGDVKAINISRAYRDELPGRQVKADIIKRTQRRQVDGEWVDGELENVIENFKSAE